MMNLHTVDDMVEKSEDEEAIGKLSVDEQDEVITNTNLDFVLHSLWSHSDSIPCGVERNAFTGQAD